VAGEASRPRGALLCGPDLLGMEGGSEIGAVLFGEEQPSVYRNLKPTHAKAALTIMQIPVHRGQSFRRIADSIPVIADSF
jgi:hypothetical protein